MKYAIINTGNDFLLVAIAKSLFSNLLPFQHECTL